MKKLGSPSASITRPNGANASAVSGRALMLAGIG